MRDQYPAQLLHRTRRQVELSDMRDLLDAASRRSFGVPSALVLMVLLDGGRKARVLVVGYRQGGRDITWELQDVVLRPCSSQYDGSALETWEALLEDAVIKGGQARDVVTPGGDLRDNLPWDAYEGNFRALAEAVTGSLEKIDPWNPERRVPMPITLLPGAGLASQPWQLLLNRYAGGVVNRERPLRYLVTLCPSLGWWAASTMRGSDRHTPGVFLRLTADALPDGEGGDWRGALAGSFGVGQWASSGDAMKTDRAAPCLGASLEVVLSHGIDDPSVPVMARVSALQGASEPESDEDDAGVDELMPRICVLLACHGATAEDVDNDAVSPLTVKLRHSKTAVGAVTVMPPKAALALGNAFAREVSNPQSVARCLDVYQQAIECDESGCVQLFQIWGSNDVIIWRPREDPQGEG